VESRVRPDAGFGTFAVRAPLRLQGDVLNQLRHVGGAADRLLTIQDSDPCSPSFGSFHYAYWRDKTSDFADVRFQEAGAMLGLLLLPAFDDLREAEGWPSRQALMAAFSAGLVNLAREQYPEGCYDEWYKGERGFAVTAFTTVAYGLAALLLDDGLDALDRDLLARTLKRAAQWLSRRDDTVKINHEIAAAAALAAVWRLTGEERWHRAAERKLEVSLAHQSEEGWFSELGGADLGYASVALDYLMIYWRLTGNDRAASTASRLIEFLAPHLHPDLTAAAEAGICRNAYVGQIGFLLLGSHPLAQAVVRRMATLADSAKRTRSYLDDDLRVCRWGILPVLAALLAGPSDLAETPAEFARCYTPGWAVHKIAGLAAYHRDDLHVYAPFAGGAVTRIYRGERLILGDLGLHIRDGDKIFAVRDYDSNRPLRVTGNGVSTSVSFGETQYLFPSFLQRLLLRAGSMTPASSRFTRSLIDRYRIRRRTSANQSVASVTAAARRFTLERQIEIDGETVRITDVLRDRENALLPEMIFPELSVCGVAASLPRTTFAKASMLRVTKTIHTGGPEPQLEVELGHG
jgi:hypothetical protein